MDRRNTIFALLFAMMAVAEVQADQVSDGQFWKDPFVEDLLANGRGVADVLLKMLAVHAATTIAVGHLTTLKRMPQYSQSLPVVAFIFAPMYPIAELIVDTYRSVWVWKFEPENRGGFQYHFAACLGMRAIPIRGHDENGVRLLDLDPGRFLLRRTTEPRGIRWLARVGILVAFLAQDLTVIILYAKRVAFSHPGPAWNPDLPLRADADFDHVNAMFAFGGFFAALISLLIEVCNWTWRYSPLGLRKRAITSDPEWYELFQIAPFAPKPACWVEVVVTQFLMTAASCRPLWLVFVAMMKAIDVMFERTGADQETFEARATTLLVSWPFMLAFCSFLLSILASCPKHFHRLLRVNSKILTVTLHTMAISYLCTTRLLGIVGICYDLAAVRACKHRNESWCVVYYLWRDPREGSLWAL